LGDPVDILSLVKMKCLAKVGIPLNPSFVGTSLYWMKHLTFIISGTVYHFSNRMWNILSVSLFAADPDLMAVGYNDKHTGWHHPTQTAVRYNDKHTGR
jgi:hypothetical protein